MMSRISQLGYCTSSDQSSSIMNEIARNEGVVYKSSGANLKGVGREDDKLPEIEEIKPQDSNNKHTPYLVGTKSLDIIQALSAATTGGGKGWSTTQVGQI